MIDNIELGKRAVACRHFQWRSGMWLYFAEARLSCKPGWQSTSAFRVMYGSDIPRLDDTGTRAMLLEAVRDAFEKPLSTIYTNGQWVVGMVNPERTIIATGATEAEAVVAALEAADAV